MTKLKLLLVEDNPADVFLVREALREESLDCDLEVVDDGEQAIQFFERVDSGGQAYVAPPVTSIARQRSSPW